MSRSRGEFISLLTYFCVFCVILHVLDNKLILAADPYVGGGGFSASIEDDSIESSTKHIEGQCIQKCPDQNRTNSEHMDCGKDCYITQCTLGCKLWEAALDSTCKEVCTENGQESPNELYCVMGCNNALNRYLSWLIDEIGTPSAPALVADSLTATSLSLEWEIPQKLIHLTKGRPYITRNYLVQWRYEEMAGDWKFCRNQSMGDNSTVRVDNLQPYTKYRFRVALILPPNREKELFSEQSVIISTLPLGTPSSEPAIVRAVAVDHTRISVSWEPGPFPNGPILSYVLQIKDLKPDGYFALKDIPATDNFFLIEKLAPDTDYVVSVTMRNIVGEGPAALTMVHTPLAPEIRIDEPKTTLILGAEYSVLSQGIDLLSDPAQTIYQSDSKIMGIAIHIAKKLLFVSDEAGYIYKAPLEAGVNRREMILPSEHSFNFSPLLLSMDWLNDHLYILYQVQFSYQRQWQISRCDLNGERLTVVIAGLQRQPSHIEVDPYNGYLFWVINESGLFRLDLGDVSNGVKHEVDPFTMLAGSDLGAFAIDYIRFKILVPIQDNNTVLSMDLDGKKKEDIRKNTQSPKFRIVKSLAVANQIFYWTNGEDVLNEEYHTIEKNYYHNAYPDLSNRTFSFVRINHTSAQPIPVPVNPPSNVQALLSVRKGIVSWHVPHLLGIQGKSAWQEWNYILEITDEDDDNNTVTFGEIKETQHPVDKLKPNTNYKFRAAAYTSAGRGPWSTEFRTRTLKSPHDRYLIWSSNEGLLQSDVLGEHIHQLIPKAQLGNQNISDIAWFEDMVYFISNYTLRFYNRTSGVSGQIRSLDSVESIAVDWIGRRLYWFNTLTQLITRSNLNGYEQEPLVSLAARDTDLKIDSLRGYMYFSTGHTVEYCRLNGKHRREYFSVEVYSGRQVMGLTLDMDNERVYWIVRSYDGSSLLSAPMAGHEHLQFQEYILQDKTLQGPLTYFSDRLLWLQDEHTVIIGNMTGKNLAHIKNSRLIGLKAFSVIDPTHHVYPDIPEKLNVVPEQITASTIQISGNWKSFDITWDPVKNVTYGDVFYEVRFLGNVLETNQPSVSYNNESLLPYTPIQISIKAFTYWASSKLTKANLYSPAAAPSAPTNPRIFIIHRHSPLGSGLNVEATFRWNIPTEPNGPILGYRVYCWYEEDEIRNVVCDESETEHSYVLEKTIENLIQNVTYFFQVQAYSPGGFGEITPPLGIHTKSEKPIPAVLVASGEEIFKVDMDLKKSYLVVNTGSPLKYLNYIDNEKRLFWVTENNELISYTGSNKTKLMSIPSLILSMTVDWVERVIYWSQTVKEGGSAAYALDLNKFEGGEVLHPEPILKRKEFIYNLLIAPLDRTLFWVDTEKRESKEGQLYQFNLDSKEISLFFRDNKFMVHRTITMDSSSSNEPSIVWSNSTSQLFSIGIRSKLQIPVGLLYSDSMQNLAKDSGRIYWTKNDTLYAINTYDLYKYEMNIPDTSRILAFYHQKYPSKRCLLPLQWYKAREYVPSLMEQKERSIVLRLPIPAMHQSCEMKLVGVKYTILYKEVIEDDEEKCSFDICRSITSFENTKEIVGLKPFHKYKFQISVNNYYGEKMRSQATFGPVVLMRTATGPPSAPRNVSAEAVSPTEAIVQWLPPIELNGDAVWYEVHWQTENAIAGVTNRQQQLVHDKINNRNSHKITMNITRLLPSQPYSIWVRAYTSNTTFNQSGPVQIETLPEPQNVTVIKATPYSLDINWTSYPNISRYIVEYQSIGSTDSVMVLNSDNDYRPDSEKDNFTVNGLTPKTSYKFSILLFFNKRAVPYRWPQDNRFVFETLGDKPTAPGRPIIRHVSGDVYKVSWEPAKENGAPIEEYSLEALSRRVSYRIARSADGFDAQLDDQLNYTKTVNSITIEVEEQEQPEEKWIVYYNGTDTYWIIKDLHPITQYSFRVKARNTYGWGPYSSTSEQINEQLIPSSRRDYIIVAVLVPVMVTLFVILGGCIVFAFHRRVPDKKIFNQNTNRLTDVELANLRELPRGANFIHNTNLLYCHGPLTDADIALLPQIRRDQITMTSFLGSGAFGEVYEGLVNASDESNTRVAIKTLRKGATEQEKGEFLQEAQLMSNFKHEHILRLIGVCFDMDSLFIIMELMQGGDLLSFLRQSRPSMGNPATLSLLDLISMCVDIASGCRYLEEMHFVHRDLACRNCLVSSMDPVNRVVKIGDFGLARDIYKNDYYRKDGEGLLPVRWMSPESLVDGVFTSQSDIWAFGVLCWEIMTLGQQPYPARNNVEVLHYVRDGGRLGRPMDCPEELYELMLQCWCYRPEERPTFRYCLEVLQALKENTNESVQITSRTLNRPQSGGIFNRSYLLADENHNHNKGSLKFSCNGHERVEPPIIVTPTSSTASPHTPKYLELIYDENEDPISIISDGYEIPIPDIMVPPPSAFINATSGVPSTHSHNLECLDLCLEKERTFSSSSTVSEKSVGCPPVNSLVSKTPPILNVALPNSKEDCSSNEALLLQMTSQPNQKIKPFYTNAKVENVFTCDGKTMM